MATGGRHILGLIFCIKMVFGGIMVYIAYIALAAAVVLLSIKASQYVDLLDKKTAMSGAFIGGVLLSAVTSLPELFTSLSSILFLKHPNPGLIMGNILGSDLFNVAALSVVILIGYKGFVLSSISKSHTLVNICVCLVYGVLMLNYMGILTLEFWNINIITLIIIGLYILGVKLMSGDDNSVEDEAQEEDYKGKHLSVKTIVIRFIIVCILIVVASISLTRVTDVIASPGYLNIGSGLAGALFLGVVTSLPELVSTITLFKLGNHNVAVGNIVGSNIFNFIIIAISDIIYRGNVYDYSDGSTLNLLAFGAIAMPAMLVLLKFKNKYTSFFCPMIIVACYIGFLFV